MCIRDSTHAVAAEMPVIGFYLQTACGGRRLSYEYWKAVADTPGVVDVYKRQPMWGISSTFGSFSSGWPAGSGSVSYTSSASSAGSVTRIVFGTDVNFTRRHLFTRGHVTLAFTGHTVTAQGVEHAKHNDP